MRGANLFSKNKPLMAIMLNDNQLLTKAIQEGHDVNRPGPQNMTALHMAVLHANPEAVQLLIDAGANIEARCKNDITALGYGVAPANEFGLQTLKSKLKTPEGRASIDEGRRLCRIALTKAGADWDAVSNKTVSPRERFAHYWPNSIPEA